MEKQYTFLDTYVLQKDMRVRMPKAVLQNLNCVPGETVFDIFLDNNERVIVLRPNDDKDGSEKKK